MQASTQVLSHVDGSSTVLSNGTKVICSVSGPIEPKARQELPTQLSLEIIVKPAEGVQSTREKLVEDQVRAVLTPVLARYLHPRQLVQICFQVLEAGERVEYTVKEVSVCVNAAILALIDAGVPMLSMGCGTSLGILRENGQIIVNPSFEQLEQCESVHVCCLELGTDVEKNVEVRNVLLLDSVGSFSETQLFQVLEAGEKECIRLYTEMRQTAKEKVARDFIWKG
ncbi:exosome complex component RRP46 [Kluyveromyces marxianus]|uniref:Exosome complex component RRP46 n=2 Tax=Kluyveromyces marxianus TaxID=4911 RepID=W0TE33_KLUMD|nr:exosome complex component RRP46 [Kluyveromyces marxianus DMKU3-1042]QGN16800.1 exosome complex component RRP46 [Kluyveromyces marxianus]BAO41086.1 exosome complex component RRP46 [Kluyveromyces marxianus DMKU3-1042]